MSGTSEKGRYEMVNVSKIRRVQTASMGNWPDVGVVGHSLVTRLGTTQAVAKSGSGRGRDCEQLP